jgi:type I restriction enzyme S subunit
MSAKWPQVPLGEVLRKSDAWIAVSPDALYKEITVKLRGRGVVLRREVSGAEIAAVRRCQVRAGQFILSRIDARNGAFGIVPRELNGAIVSNDFPAFDTDESRLLPEFLGWMSRTRDFVEVCKKASEGTTNRVRLKEDKFLNSPILLPPLEEQRRIVARIEQLAARVDEAHSLQQLAASDVGTLLLRQIESLFSGLETQYGRRKLDEFSPHVTSGPRNWAERYEQDGFRFYRAQDIGPGGNILNGSKAFVLPPSGEQGRSAMLQHGDLMLVITGATVGRVSVYHNELEPGFVSQHVGICRFPHGVVDSKFVFWGLRGPSGQAQLLGQRYGQGKPGLNLSNIRSLSLPIPPIPEQRRVVADLEKRQAECDALRRLHSGTSLELEAMMPAILDRAFKGEL